MKVRLTILKFSYCISIFSNDAYFIITRFMKSMKVIKACELSVSICYCRHGMDCVFIITFYWLMPYLQFQVAASMQKDIDVHVPNYPNLPSKLICLLHNVTLHVRHGSFSY